MKIIKLSKYQIISLLTLLIILFASMTLYLIKNYHEDSSEKFGEELPKEQQHDNQESDDNPENNEYYNEENAKILIRSFPETFTEKPEIIEGVSIKYLAKDSIYLTSKHKELLVDSLKDWKYEWPSNNTFLLDNFAWHEYWAFGAIRPDVVNVPQGESLGSTSNSFVMLKKDTHWEIAYNADKYATELLSGIPEEEFDNDSKQTFFYDSYPQENNISRTTSTTPTYQLPWKSEETYSLNYDRKNNENTAKTGWHGSWPNINQALDLNPVDSTKRKMYSVVGGKIKDVCKNSKGKQAWIQIQENSTSQVTTIMHMDKNSIPATIYDGASVSSGSYLGELYNGSGNEADPKGESNYECDMYSTGLHLHLGMPSKPVSFENYTFTTNSLTGRVIVKNTDGTTLAESTKLSSTNTGGSTTNSCLPPSSGDWNVSQNCTITSSVSAPGNVKILSGAQLTIENNASLNINFISYALKVEPTGKIIIKPLGKLI